MFIEMIITHASCTVKEIINRRHFEIFFFLICSRKQALALHVLRSTHNLCFFSRNKKNNIYPCKPQFYYIKVGFKGVKIVKACFRDGSTYNFILVSSQNIYMYVLIFVRIA